MSVQVTPRPTQVYAAPSEKYILTALGDTVYYKSTRDVSSSSYDGTLTNGQSLEIASPIWVATTADKGGGFQGSASLILIDVDEVGERLDAVEHLAITDLTDVDSSSVQDKSFLRWDAGAAKFRGVADVAEMWKPTDVAAEVPPGGRLRTLAAAVNLTSGTMFLSGGAAAPPGVPLTGIRCWAGSTVGASLTHAWFTLVRQTDMAVLAVTSDDTSSSWAANSPKALTWTNPITLSQWTPVYVGVVVVGTTPPNLIGFTSPASTITNASPRLAGNSTTGLTDPSSVGATVATPGSTATIAYAQITK